MQQDTVDLPKMRKDIKPLCCIHHSVMTAIKPEKYACHEAGCGVYWGPVREYERLVKDSSATEQLLELVSCPKAGHGHMFVSGFDPATGIEVWQCSIENCLGQEERPQRGWEPKYRYQQLRAATD